MGIYAEDAAAGDGARARGWTVVPPLGIAPHPYAARYGLLTGDPRFVALASHPAPSTVQPCPACTDGYTELDELDADELDTDPPYPFRLTCDTCDGTNCVPVATEQEMT